MRYEGVVIVDGAVLYRTRPLYCKHTAFSEADKWAELHGYRLAHITTQTRA